MNRKDMITSVDSGKLLQHFLLNGTTDQILRMYADGYPLDAQGLEALYCRGFSKAEILPLIKQAGNISSPQDVYNWLCGFIGKEEADNFVASLNNFSDAEVLQKLPPEILAKHSRFDILQQIKADDILYQYGKYEFLSLQALFNHKFYELFFAKGGVIVSSDKTDALKYLEENKLWRIIYANASYWSTYKKAQPFLDILIRNKRFNEILGMFDGEKYLAKSDEGIAFLKNKNDQHLLAKAKLYDDINWDIYFLQNRDHAATSAAKARNWQVLVEHKCSKELFKHKKYISWLKSLF